MDQAGSDPKPESQTPDEGTPSKLRKVFQKITGRIRWRIYQRFPNLFTKLFNKEEWDYYRARDIEENLETHLPDDEQFCVQSIMAAELYGPNEINNLFAGIHRYNWKNPAGYDEYGDAAKWLRTSRELGGFGGKFWLGHIFRNNDERLSSRKLSGPIPPGIENISLYILPITSSLTCVVATFNLSDLKKNVYSEILNRDARTYYERTSNGGVRVWGVQHLKQKGIREARRHLRDVAATWFKDTIPGIFSSGQLGQQLVTLELLTTKEADPFPKEYGSAPSWMKNVSIESPIQAWKCDDLEQLKLTWDLWPHEESGVGVAAMNISQIPDKKMELYGGRERGAFNYIAEQQLRSVISRHATMHVLHGFLRNLNNARDTIRNYPASKKGIEQVLSQVEDFFVVSLGVPSILGELKEYSSNDRLFSRHISSFSEVRPFREEDTPIKLADSMQKTITYLSRNLQEIDKSARELFLQYSSLVSTQESVRTQRTMKHLTVATIFLAGVSIGIAVLDGDKILKRISEILF